MSEADAIRNSVGPLTFAGLAAQFAALGLRPGSILMVHVSLSALGWVCGGPVTVIEALLDVLGSRGTLVMPAHSGQLSDPAIWRAPAVPRDWHAAIREAMPAFDPARTPTRGMGVVPELFRTWPGARRSAHPAVSLAAMGPRAEAIIGHHPLDDPFGESSPLARLYDLDAAILLLGVGYDRCTALHLAERRAWPDAPAEAAGAPVTVDGVRRWVRYRMPAHDSAAFPEIGTDMDRDGLAITGRIGRADARLLSFRAAVDYASALRSGRPH